MIEEQTRDRNREHRRHKEEKENMKSAGCTVDSRIALPEINKILKQRQHSKQAKKAARNREIERSICNCRN